MRLLSALHTLEQYDRQGHTIWSVCDLRMVFDEKPAAFRKTIERLCREGILERVSRGVYLFKSTRRDRHEVLGEAIGELRKGEYCFESLESAASIWGIVPQTPLGGITIMTTGRSGRVTTPFGPVEYVHTDASINEILANTIPRDGFVPLATREYVIHGLRRCGRTTELDEVVALEELEES